MPLIEELQKWSKGINCTTVLILDNCDDILSSLIRDNFISQIDMLIQYSQSNLHIILVSQEKLVLLDWFDRWTVKELSNDSSIELLEKLAPGIKYSHAKTVAELVGRCPLALKVVGNLLHIYGDTLTQNLEEELKENPIDVLDQASIRKQQFRAIMNIVFKRLDELKECGYAVSLFPGSFSQEAGCAILSDSPKRCLNLFTKHSLLDEYLHGYHHRYKMHRLIKEYFVEKLSDVDKVDFVNKFCLYYETFLLRFATNTTIVDESEWHMMKSDEHNIFLYLQNLISREDLLSVDQLVILGFSLSQKWISIDNLQKHSKLFMENLDDVCDRLDPVTCGKLYSSVVPQVYQECRCQSFEGYIQKVFYRPCLQVFSCEAAYKLNRTESIWVQLSVPEKEFVERLIRYNCYKNVDIAFSFSVWSSIILIQIAGAVTAIRKAYFVLISFLIALIESYFYLIINESEVMVFIEIIPRKLFCQVLPVVVSVAVSMPFVHCVSRNHESLRLKLNRMVITTSMLMSGFLSLYFLYPYHNYINYTVFCPLLPICY